MLNPITAGVLIAVGAFITQEVVRWIVRGILFRLRLVSDIGQIVANFSSWKPPIAVHLPPLHGEDQGYLLPSAIWDYGYESLNDVYANSSNLLPDLFVRVVRLYSACGRFDEIRCSYNKAIVEALKASDKKPWFALINGRLKDIESVAKEIVQTGSALLDEMAESYWFTSRVGELVTENRGKQEASNSRGAAASG